ncbi:MAG: choline ABC transporter permease subunit [Paracoccus sp. (in: a-proteobacteria)]|nr:choline ABC transporter permease subunit [Paracoccus sp. (in: a-proteobacteria)]
MQRQIGDLITGEKIPVGEWIAQGVDWLTVHHASWFDALSSALGTMIGAVQYMLATPHPITVIIVAMGLAWLLQRRWAITLGTGLGLAFVLNQGLWTETMQSLTLVLCSCILCMAMGVPLGVLFGHRPRLYAWVRPLLDLMQTLPTFVYLIPAVVFFGLGMVPGLIATVIFALPAPVRLTQLGIASTPPALRETALAFGATPRQLLWKVEIPSALPQIMAGLNQAIMLSLSMVVIAALVGASGLGVPVLRALNSLNTRLGFESGLVIVVVAVVLDRMLRMRGRA